MVIRKDKEPKKQKNKNNEDIISKQRSFEDFPDTPFVLHNHMQEGLLLRDMVENKKELDKKEGYSFRFNKRLMDNVKSYAELKGVNTTDIITTFIENQLDTVVAIREELNEPIAVYKDNGKRYVFIGYVNWNNFLDRWNGHTYCYDNDINIHKGISYIISDDKKEYVLIENKQDSFVRLSDKNDLLYVKDYHNEDIRKGTPKNYIGNVISEKEAIEEILKSGHGDLLITFPEFKNKINEKKLHLLKNINHKIDSNVGINELLVNDILEENNVLKDKLTETEEYIKSLEKLKEVITPKTIDLLKKFKELEK
jgi:hypothetical protein